MKRVFTMLMAVIMILTIAAPMAYATERNCKLTFIVGDETQGALGEDVTLHLESQGSDKVFEFTLLASEGYGEKTFEVAYGYVYNLTVSYPSMNTGDWHVICSNGREIETTIDANVDEIQFNWLVIPVGGEDMPVDDGWLERQKPFVVDGFFTIWDEVSEDDPEWETLFKYYAMREDSMAESYERCTGNPKGDFYGFTAKEQILVYVLYVLPQSGRNATNFGSVYGCEENYKQNVIRPAIWAFEYYGYDELQRVYTDIACWMYFYYLETGEWYNFVPEIITRNNQGEVPTAPPEVTETLATAPNRRPEPSDAPTTPGQAEPEGTGVWDGVWEGLQRNWFTLSLLVIACGVLLVIIIVRKSKNIDDE